MGSNMDEQTAWQIIRTSYRCSAELQDLLKLAKARCTAEEYKPIALAIATVIDTANTHLVDRAVAAHPGLGNKIESDIAKFGRLT
jgi:hypothetical protein